MSEAVQLAVKEVGDQFASVKLSNKAIAPAGVPTIPSAETPG